MGGVRWRLEPDPEASLDGRSLARAPVVRPVGGAVEQARTLGPAGPARLAGGALAQPATVLRLQRAAGNRAVATVMRTVAEEQPPGRSLVLDVVGKGGGQPLAPDLRSDMEGLLGSDLSAVRVHTDTTAADSAASVGARAYTVGNEIVFGAGAFEPTSPEGERTLVHELVHVEQQRRGPVAATDTGAGVAISDPSDAFERQAESIATSALAAGTRRAGR